MNERKNSSSEIASNQRIAALILIMVLVSLLIGGTTLALLYNTAFTQFRAQLVDIAKSRASLIGAVAEFDKTYSSDFPGGTKTATISQIRKAHENFEGFGETGEFALAEIDGDRIHFILRHRHGDRDLPEPVPMWSKLAEPMRRAVSGKSGSLIGIDYRGELVLAAHEPVPELNLGVVAKIDMSEIRRPFINIGLLVGGGAVGVIGIAVFIFFQISNPLISQILTTEKASRDAEKKRRELENIVDHSPVIVFLWKNAEGWPVEFVSENIRNFGYSPADFYSGRVPFADIVHPDDLERVANEVSRYSQEGREHFTQEYRMKTVSGEFKWIDDRTWIRRNKEGEITHYQGIVLDISERKKAQEKLFENEVQIKRERDQAQRYLDVSPVMFAVLDTRGNIVLINEKGCRLLGYEESEILFQNWFDLLIPENIREQILAVFDKLMTGEVDPVEHFENVVVTKQGEHRLFSFHNSIIQDEKSNVTGILFSAEDITERDSAEKALTTANTALKTISKANEALVHATNEEQLLSDVSRIVVQEGGYRMAWIGFMENDENRSILPVSHYGYEHGYLDGFKFSWSDEEDKGKGPAGTACREARPVIVSDVESSLSKAISRQLEDEENSINRALDERIPFYRQVLARMMKGNFERVVPADPCDEISEFGVSLTKLNHVLDNRFAEIRALSEITTEINEGLFLDDVLNHVYDTFRPIIPYDRIGFALLEDGPDQNSDKVVRAYWARSEFPKTVLRKGYALPLGRTSLGDVLLSGKPRIINDLKKYKDKNPHSESTRRITDEGVRSSLTCPLIAKGETVGFMFFSSSERETYREAHIELFVEIAGQLALTVEKSKLYQDLTIRNEFIRKLFGRYISDEIAEALLENPDALKMGGRKCQVTVLMSDIRGFTTMSEQLSPEEVVAVLNNQLDVMVGVIREFGGTIDNFIGDAIMVLFGAPLAKKGDVERAIACALAMQDAMEDVNRRNLASGLPEIQMGIGINTGDVVAGNIGSETHAKYSVIGAPVNLAARIESLSKAGQVLISEQTYKAVEDVVEIKGTQEAKVKGVERPVTVYEVSKIVY